MRFWSGGVSLACLIVLSFSTLGCNNAVNPFCASARPAPLIGFLSPNTVSFSQVQSGMTLTVNGSHFVSSSEVLINSVPLSATVVSDQQMNVTLSPDVISGPGKVKVEVQTPSGNTSDLGCTSGGITSALTLTVN